MNISFGRGCANSHRGLPSRISSPFVGRRRRRQLRIGAAALVALAGLSSPASAADYVWTGLGGDGLWTTAANWSPIGVPGVDDNVTVQLGDAVASANGSFHNLTNCGSIEIAGGGAFTPVNAVIVNTGALSFGPGGVNAPALVIPCQTSTTLTGGGRIHLNRADALIRNNYCVIGAELINQNNTIHGFGQIGIGGPFPLSLVNNGVIDADESGQALSIVDGVFLSGAGFYRASNGGRLMIGVPTFVALTGGTLETSGGGVIQARSIADTTNNGSLVIDDGRVMDIAGTFTNNGTVQWLPGVSDSTLRPANNAIFAGAGQIVLGRDTAVLSASDNNHVMTNESNTIRGFGVIGASQNRGNAISRLVNNAIIDADATGQTLHLGVNCTNNGLLLASGGGTLSIRNAVDNTAVEMISGRIIADGAGSNVLIGPANGAASVLGGSIEAINGGSVTVNQAALADLTIVGALQFIGQNTSIRGAIQNEGLITNVPSPLPILGVRPSESAYLTGQGEILLNDAELHQIGGGFQSATITNHDNLIHGFGRVGGSANVNITFVINEGDIVADVGGQTLFVTSFGENHGLMQARDGGTLRFEPCFGVPFQNVDGVIEALPGSRIETGPVTLRSTGVLRQVGSGAFAITGGGRLEFSTFHGDLAQAAGTLAPGAGPGGSSLGAATLTGNYTKGSDATLEIQFGPTGADTLAITGNAVLGGPLSVVGLPGFAPQPGAVFNVVHVGGTRTGVFSNAGEGANLGSVGGQTLFLTYRGGAGGRDVSVFALLTAGSTAFGGGSGGDRYFVGDRPGDPNAPAQTFDIGNFDILSGQSFTLNPGETLNLSNGLGTLQVAPGATFIANGLINGSILNAGLFIIPITRVVVVNQTTGGIVRLPDPSAPFTSPQPLVFNANTFVDVGYEFGAGLSTSGGRTSFVTPAITNNAMTTFTDASVSVSGSFTQTATGALRMFIAGDERGVTYSALDVGAGVTLAGQLQVVLQPELFEFLPHAGDAFDLVMSPGGVTIAPEGLEILTLVTTAGAGRLLGSGVSVSPYSSGIAGDPNSLKQIDQPIFRLSIEENGSVLRITALVGLNPCSPDFNGDGVLDPDDLSDYIGCFFTPPCPAADFNRDGFANPDDLSDYIGAYFRGGC